ncbi:MAG: hypothetical protein MJZ27_10005 [Bacteroidales bacterium]|nr:hypothetical protein [Bacteroidales bacterium]
MIKSIKKILVALYYRYLYYKAQKLANHLHCKVYCLRIKDKPILLTRDRMLYLRKKRVLRRNISSYDLARMSLFTVLPKNK